jgi:hypothetical protein
MATTTPNYGWPVPTSTDYVKDGATAIEALGDAIDATVFGLGSSGLTLVKTQTIGPAVSNVTVTAAFNSTYDNYRIIVSGGVASTTSQLALTLGSTSTGYYAYGIYGYFNSATITGGNVPNAAQWGGCGGGTTNSLAADILLQSPNLAKNTMMAANWSQSTTTGQIEWKNGYLANTTQYTDFTLTPNTGTLTGGTIRVYGYKNS